MFSVKEKQSIAQEIEKLLLKLAHPEMPTEKPKFKLHVDGKESWSWADIEPNWTFDGKSAEECELCRKPVDECECVDEIVICSKCKGTGHIQFYVGGPYSECKREECDVCKGSGRVLQKINATKMPYTGKPKYTKILQ